MVGISVDPTDKSQELASKLSLPFPLLEDKGLSVTRTYKVADEKNEIAFPAVFVVNRAGAIVWKYLGEAPPDRPPTAEVLTALESLRR